MAVPCARKFFDPVWALVFFLSLWGFWLGGAVVASSVLVLGSALAYTAAARRVAVQRGAQLAAWRIALRRIAGSLGAGASLSRALHLGAGCCRGQGETSCVRGDPGQLGSLANAATFDRLGGDPAELLRAAPESPAGQLAACLGVAGELGIAVRPLVADLAVAVERGEQVTREASLSLASARATARLLAALPLVGFVFGELVNRQSVSILFGDSTGHGCLLAAAVLEASGLVWVQRISDRASA